MLSKEEIEFNLKALSGVMLNFEDRLCDEMQERVKEVKEYIEQLEHDKDIMQRALNIQTVGWNEGAKLFAVKQKLIEKLEEDTNKPIPLAEDMDWIRCRKEYAKEILEILK